MSGKGIARWMMGAPEGNFRALAKKIDEAITAAQERGRREGLEEALKACGITDLETRDRFAAAIRSRLKESI